MELVVDGKTHKGFHCVVPDRKFPTSFKYDLESVNLDKNAKLYIVNLDSKNYKDRYRTIIEIPFNKLQDVSPYNNP